MDLPYNPHAEFARLMTDYFHDNLHDGMARNFSTAKHRCPAPMVNDQQIPISSTVTSYENTRQSIEQAGFGAVGICYCRHKKQHPQPPGHHDGKQLHFLGNGTRFLIRHDFTKQQIIEHLLSITEQAC